MHQARQHPPSARADERHLRECPDCGLFQVVPALPARATASCTRCGAVLRRTRRDPLGRALAWAIAGLALYSVALTTPLIGLDLYGRSRDAVLLSAPIQLDHQGMWELAALVLATVVLMPLLKLLLLTGVLLALRLQRPPRFLPYLFRWYERIGPWAMIEVFLLGLFVAYTKLLDLAQVEIGPAAYGLGGLMLVMVAADAALDPEAVWEAMEARGVVARPRRGRAQPDRPGAAMAAPPGGVPVGCPRCRLVSLVPPEAAAGSCPRCGAALRARKPASLARSWALLATATLLYIPANVLPVMTVISLGRGGPHTILSGVIELAASGMWPLAALVFAASITVPVLKLIGLAIMLVSVQRGWTRGLRDRTRLYRIVETIGRWSMIDIFMLSILVALVRMGFIASVEPGTGALAFAAVVLLTMFAAASFDPRLMWDAAGQRRAGPASLPAVADPAR